MSRASIFGRFNPFRKGPKTPPKVNPSKGRGGLMGKAGGFGLGSLFGGMNDAISDMQGGGQDGNVGSVAVAGQNNMTNAAAATSVLSDADSSDPVVRQLQDIEEVLVSIKGDTSNFVSGIGSKQPQAANMSALRSGFSMPKEMTEFGKAAAALGGLLAGIPLLLAAARDNNNNEENGDGTAVGKPLTEDERRQNIVLDEAGDLAATAGMKGAGRVAGAVGEAVGDAVTERSQQRVAKTIATRVDTSTGGARPRADGTVVNSKGKEIHGAAADAVKQNVEALQKVEAKAILEGGEAGASRTAKVSAAIAKVLGGTGAKVFPLIGEAFNVYFAATKMMEDPPDVVGALGELGGAIPFVGAGFDVASMVRDIYKEVYGEKPEETEGGLNGDLVAARMAEIAGMVGTAMADMVRINSDDPEGMVEARPEVSGTGRMKRAKVMAQKDWDKKFGATHNPDGSPKDLEGNNVEGAPAAPMLEQPNTFEGAVPATPLGSDDIDDATNAVTSNQREQDQLVLTTALASSIGTQGQNTQTFTPEVSVSVTAPKTSFPTKNAELEFINSNGRHLV